MRMQNRQVQDAVGEAKRRCGPVGVSALLGLVVGLGFTPSGWATTYTFSSIDFNASGTTVATGINDNGQIVGSYGATGATHGFLRSGAAFGQIDVSGVPGNATNTRANGINENGWIVGSYDANGTTHGFEDVNGHFNVVNFLGATDTRAFGINHSGEIVGSYNNNTDAFLYSGGAFSRIDPPAGTLAAQANGINDSGQIVGYYFDIGGLPHGFLDNEGTISQINVSGAIGTYANGINDNGLIVGNYIDSNLILHGFLDSGGSFSLINVPFQDATDTRAYGINDNGQIVESYHDGFGTHGFLASPVLAPVPVPASGVLLSLGLAALGSMAIWNRRRGKTGVLVG